jgi:hypothetical protein
MRIHVLLEWWMLPALVGGMVCALVAQYLAARTLIRLGVPLTREVETGQVADQPVTQHERTPVALAVDAIAYLGGFLGGGFVLAYLIQQV